MAEFQLPKNSRIGKGKSFKAPAGAKNIKVFRVYRWNPDDEANPTIDSFEVDLDNCGPMVLDAIIKIKDEGEGFNPDNVPDPTTKENLAKPCGRGIMLMRVYMDEVTYSDCGTEVTLMKTKKP